MKKFCRICIDCLRDTPNEEWGHRFIQLKLHFFYRYQYNKRNYLKSLVLSTWHGSDFFENVIYCLEGGKLDEPPGICKDNWDKLIEIGRNLS